MMFEWYVWDLGKSHKICLKVFWASKLATDLDHHYRPPLLHRPRPVHVGATNSHGDITFDFTIYERVPAQDRRIFEDTVDCLVEDRTSGRFDKIWVDESLIFVFF